MIDGVSYDISNPTQVELWNCKQAIYEIVNEIDLGRMDMLEQTNYLSWRKELVSKLKDYDKLYLKHIKGGHVEMNTIHMTAMKPLTNLLESNLNFYYLE